MRQDLINLIKDNIKANNDQKITADVVSDVLTYIVNFIPEEPIYKDGTIAKDVIKIVSPDGVEETYRETAVWYDGTTITNNKVDDDIFIIKNGKYYNKAIADNTSLKISNISQLRLTNGYYEGHEVTLLGYYNSGDKLPVTYKFTVQNYDTIVDDGGKYIKSTRGTWVAQFNGKASVKDFGALNSQNIDGILNKMFSISDINTVICEKGVYRIPFANSVIIPANKTLHLHRQTEIRKAASAGFVPSIIINGDNAQLYGGKFITEGNSLHEGTVVIRKGHKIKIDGPFFENSTIGIRVVPKVVDGVEEIVSNLDILNPEFNNCKYGIDFGEGVEGPVGVISDPFIFNMTFNNGKVIAEGGDGIKTRQKVSGLRVAFSYIDGPSRDCIDLFASGDGVRIYNCTFKNAVYKGIDIKREPGYDESVFGTNGERIAIVDTTFDNLPIGISVSGNYDAGNYKGNKYIRMQGNTFNKIATRSIVAAGKYLRIYDNDFINCSWNDTVNHPSVDIGQDTGVANTVNRNICIKGNTFTNCCSSIAPSLNTEAVIRIADYCKGVQIYDNIIENDTDKPRPNMFTGVYVNANSEAFFRNNTINVLGKPVHGVSGSRIVGVKIPLTLGTKPALFNRTQKIWKFDRKMQIISADISVTTSVPADGTNYSTGDVQVNGVTFIPFNTISGVDTNLNRKLASTTNYLAQQDQDMQIRYNNAGTGQVLENLTMVINAVEC